MISLRRSIDILPSPFLLKVGSLAGERARGEFRRPSGQPDRRRKSSRKQEESKKQKIFINESCERTKRNRSVGKLFRLLTYLAPAPPWGWITSGREARGELYRPGTDGERVGESRRKESKKQKRFINESCEGNEEKSDP